MLPDDVKEAVETLEGIVLAAKEAKSAELANKTNAGNANKRYNSEEGPVDEAGPSQPPTRRNPPRGGGTDPSRRNSKQLKHTIRVASGVSNQSRKIRDG